MTDPHPCSYLGAVLTFTPTPQFRDTWHLLITTMLGQGY